MVMGNDVNGISKNNKKMGIKNKGNIGIERWPSLKKKV